MPEAKKEHKEKIYLDTFVFMDLLSGNDEYTKKITIYLDKIKSGHVQGIVSSVLLAELAFHIKRRKGTEKAEEILYYIQSLQNLLFIPVSQDIAKHAGILRARYAKKIEKKLTYFDCIHLATAISEKCSKFVTGDRGFRDIKEIAVEIY
jgi:predicted nucleic acid-binding protein